jgi:DNA sulfur modification protein DndC
LSESVLENKSFVEIFEEIRTVYLNDNRPWIIGFSGGKDSTCMVQLVWNALSALPAEKLTKKIYIISSNTLVEAPQIAERITDSLDRMEKNAKKIGLPIGTNLLRPKTEDTFWVRLLGLGYPAPTTLFRWCTDMLKISNADRFIQETVSKHGEAIVLLGTRKSESVVRKQSMNTYKIEGSVLSRHSQFDQTFVYTPIEDFSSEDVWNYLLENQNPWGEENRDLLAMYQDANASECPLVIDTTTPSCGGGRFGCWTCTVVDKQSYLTNMIESDEKNEWMEVLAELRQKLKDTQDSSVWEKYRERKRRNGRIDLKTHDELVCANRILDPEKEDGLPKIKCNTKNLTTSEKCKECLQPLMKKCRKCGVKNSPSLSKCKICFESLIGHTPGPYKMEFRIQYLRDLLKGQMKIQELKNDPDMELILEEEIDEIQRIWRMEQGDWKNTAYAIYAEITGKNLNDIQNELGNFSSTEQELLEETCSNYNISFKLVSNLLNLELKSQGANRHTKVFDKIRTELSKEWRDVDNDKEFEKILGELQVKKDIKAKAMMVSDVKQGE